MKPIESHLSEVFASEFEKLGVAPALGTVFASERPELGDFQCNGALAAAKGLSQSPRAIAEQIMASLADRTEFKLDIAGPGFINIRLDDEFLAHYARAVTKETDFTTLAHLKDEKTIIDYGGMNLAKPLHIGHLRSSIIGESLKRLYRLLGSDIQGDIHMGDWGTQMGMVIYGLSIDKPSLPYFDESFSGPYPTESPVTMDELSELYPRISSLSKVDEEVKKASLQATLELQQGRAGYRALWQHIVNVSVQDIKQQMDELDVHFDLWNGESHYHDRIPGMIQKLRDKGLAVESNGALVIHLDPINGKELPPLILEKSDGAYLYGTTDLATIDDRAESGVKRSLVLADQRQQLHFQQVFAGARLSGIAPEDMTLQYLGFGTMNGSDGKPFKSRAGGLMRLSELIEMVQQKALERMEAIGVAKDYDAEEKRDIAKKVGLAALKFGDLSNNATSDYLFDLDKFVSFEGKTGPYLVYTTVRIKSVYKFMDRHTDSATDMLPPTNDKERALLLSLTKLPHVLQTTQAGNSPHTLCEHLFSLAQDFNRFYQSSHIASQTDKAIQDSWLSICWLTQQHLELGLDLLGIQVPERM